jgi:predicted Rossmann-fold nucleotide-binding protein
VLEQTLYIYVGSQGTGSYFSRLGMVNWWQEARLICVSLVVTGMMQLDYFARIIVAGGGGGVMEEIMKGLHI